MPHPKSAILMTSLLVAGTLSLGGCSSSPLASRTGGEELSQTGPTVLEARADPGTFEVTRELKPLQTPVVLAEVKDLSAEITSVRLRFNHAPIIVPMKRVAGTTWRAILSPEQIRKLAVSGRTMKYDAQVIAANSKGRQGVSGTFAVQVRAPEIDATG